MNSDRKNILKRGITLILCGPFVSALAIGLAGVKPLSEDGSGIYSVTNMYIALGFHVVYWFLALIGAGFRYFTGEKSWIVAYILISMSLFIFLGFLPLNLIVVSLPSWRWIIPLAGMYPIAALLPLINDRVSGLLHREIFFPKSRFGRVLSNLLWIAVPSVGILGASITKLSRQVEEGLIGFSIIGIIAHIIFVWGSVSLAHQAWEQRPHGKKGL